MTIDELLMAYQAAKLSHQRRGRSTGRTLRALLEPVLQEPAHSLNAAVVEQLVGVLARSAPVHADRAVGYLMPMLSWAVALGHVPADVMELRLRPKPLPPRERSLSMAELRRVWCAAASLGYPFGSAIQLLVLIPTTREVIGAMRVSDLRKEAAGAWAWATPELGPRPFRLPDLSVDVLRGALGHRPAGSDLVFSTTGTTPVSGWSKVKRRLDMALTAASGDSPAEPWRLNDLRRSFEVVAQEQLGVDRWVIERCLGRITAFSTPMLRELAESEELQREAEAALAQWAMLVTADA